MSKRVKNRKGKLAGLIRDLESQHGGGMQHQHLAGLRRGRDILNGLDNASTE